MKRIWNGTWVEETPGNRVYDVLTLLELSDSKNERLSRFVLRVARHALRSVLQELNAQEGTEMYARQNAVLIPQPNIGTMRPPTDEEERDIR